VLQRIVALIVLSFFASLGFAHAPVPNTTTSPDTSLAVARCHYTITGSTSGVEFTITKCNRSEPVCQPR
jgi:hypothetical protein